MIGNGLKEYVDRFIRRMEREDVNIHGFILSQGGRILVSAYYEPFSEGQPHRMYSVSKTLTGLAVGMLIDEGKVRLEDHIADYFADWLPHEPDGRLLRQTVGDMLRMCTCFNKTAYREYEDQNWSKAFFEVTPDHEPGTVFMYDTGCSQVLAELVRRLSGRGVFDFLNERLFIPLGAADQKYWLKDPSGCETGGTGLCISLRDLHKIAQCLADGGCGIVPSWYIREMTRKHADTPLQPNAEERYGYGWQCWRTRAGWSMFGMGGQLAVICPEKDAILCTIADTRLDPAGVQRIYDAFFDEIYPALGCETMAPEQLSLKPHVLPNAPDSTRDSAGPYVFDSGNPLCLERLSIKAGFLTYTNGHGKAELPLCPGKVIRISFPGTADEPALVNAGWTDQGVLRVRCHAIGDAPCGFELLIAFRDPYVTVQARMSPNLMTRGYEGVASGVLEGVSVT